MVKKQTVEGGTVFPSTRQIRVIVRSVKKNFICAFSGKHNALHLPEFFWFLQISQHGGSMRYVQLCPKYSCKNLYKNWNIYFHKTYHNQIWHACTSWGVSFDSNETNQAGACDIIMSGSCDFKRCSNFLSGRAMIIKFGQIISKRY